MAWISTAASTAGAACESNSSREPTPAGSSTSASAANGANRVSLMTAVRMPSRRANRSACTVSAG